MADQKSRGGKKQASERQPTGKRKQPIDTRTFGHGPSPSRRGGQGARAGRRDEEE